MAMTSGGGGGKKRPMSDINITPMVDVMLVLLVIFMVTAPIIKQMDVVNIKLPALEGPGAQTIVTEDARTIVIKPDGSVAKSTSKDQSESYKSMADLIAELKDFKAERDAEHKDAVVVIAGDRETKWERVMQVWNATKSAGITQLSFEVESGKSPEPAAPKTADSAAPAPSVASRQP